MNAHRIFRMLAATKSLMILKQHAERLPIEREIITQINYMVFLEQADKMFLIYSVGEDEKKKEIQKLFRLVIEYFEH